MRMHYPSRGAKLDSISSGSTTTWNSNSKDLMLSVTFFGHHTQRAHRETYIQIKIKIKINLKNEK